MTKEKGQTAPNNVFGARVLVARVNGKVSAPHPFTGSEAPPRGKVKRVRLRDVANTEPLCAMSPKILQMKQLFTFSILLISIFSFAQSSDEINKKGIEFLMQKKL